MKFKIAVMVGSNGKLAAMEHANVDWGILADGIMDWDAIPASDPEATAKYVVEVEIPLPSVTTVEATAVLVETP